MALRAAANRLPLYRQLYASSSSSAISAPFRIACFPRYPPHVIRCQSTIPSNAKIETIVRSEKDKDQSSNNWKIKMLYDGGCPLCMREVNMLKERNKSYGAIKFVDISSEDYTPAENQGLDYETAMGRIHAVLSDGTVVRDVEAFRRLYEEVGLGWVYAITKYEPDQIIYDSSVNVYVAYSNIGLSDIVHDLKIATVANVVYSVWAKYRLQITGRPPLDNILEARKQKMGEACTDEKVCKM